MATRPRSSGCASRSRSSLGTKNTASLSKFILFQGSLRMTRSSAAPFAWPKGSADARFCSLASCRPSRRRTWQTSARPNGISSLCGLAHWVVHWGGTKRRKLRAHWGQRVFQGDAAGITGKRYIGNFSPEFEGTLGNCCSVPPGFAGNSPVRVFKGMPPASPENTRTTHQ